jgi:Ca2+-binding EF-hand superfamily protein
LIKSIKTKTATNNESIGKAPDTNNAGKSPDPPIESKILGADLGLENQPLVNSKMPLAARMAHFTEGNFSDYLKGKTMNSGKNHKNFLESIRPNENAEVSKNWMNTFSKLITDSIGDEFRKLKKKTIKKFDTNQDGKLDRKELAEMLASKSFWGTLLLFMLPVLTAFMQIANYYFDGSGSFSWGPLILVAKLILAPMVAAGINKFSMEFNTKLKMQVEGSNEKLRNDEHKFKVKEEQLLSAINLQSLFIRMNNSEPNLPNIDVMVENTLAKEFQKLKNQFDTNKDGVLSRKELNLMLASKEMWGSVILLMLPILTAIIEAWQIYATDGVWTWDSVLLILQYILAPVIVAWVRKSVNVSNKNLETDLVDLSERSKITEHVFSVREQQLVSVLNLYAQFIQQNTEPEKIPSDVFYNNVRGEEMADQNAQLSAETFGLKSRLKALIIRLKQLDPTFESQFLKPSTVIEIRQNLINRNDSEEKSK